MVNLNHGNEVFESCDCVFGGGCHNVVVLLFVGVVARYSRAPGLIKSCNTVIR